MLNFKKMEVDELNVSAGVIEHRKVEFSNVCFYCAINIVHIEDGRKYPWLVVLQDKKDKSPFWGKIFSVSTEEEALSKAEEFWKEVKDGLIAYLAKI